MSVVRLIASRSGTSVDADALQEQLDRGGVRSNDPRQVIPVSATYRASPNERRSSDSL
jgi:hypothetical protein